MSFSSVLPRRLGNKPGPLVALAGLGLSLIVPYSHAALLSSYDYQVRNTLRGAQGMGLPAPQPIAQSNGSRSSDQGELVAIASYSSGDNLLLPQRVFLKVDASSAG